MHFHNDEKWGFHRRCDSTSHFKDELAEVFIMDRRCPILCERSGGWGQKQLILLVPLGTIWDGGSSQSAELPCLLTADWEQVNAVFWLNKASHAALLPHRENQATVPFGDQEDQQQPPTWLTWAGSFPSSCQNAWMIPSLPERVAKLLKSSVEWVVLELDSQGTGYQDWEAFAKSNYMD